MPAALGVSRAERAMRRPALIDVVLRLDLRRAGRSDRLADTIDYARLHAAIEEVARAEHRLVESLAEGIASRLLAGFPIQACTVTVRKPNPVAGTLRHAGVRITRSRGA